MSRNCWCSWSSAAALLLTGFGVTRAQVPSQDSAARLRAMAAAVRADLRHLVVAQEAYFADHVRYATSVDSLQYSPSSGVTVTVTGAPRGWSASAKHAGAEFTCFIYVGNVPKPRPEATEGAPLCEGVPGGEVEGMAADSLQRVMSQMGPMFGNMMSNMYEGLIVTLARPDVADRLAAFTRNYYEALVRRGFAREEALRIVASVGIPTLR